MEGKVIVQEAKVLEEEVAVSFGWYFWRQRWFW